MESANTMLFVLAMGIVEVYFFNQSLRHLIVLVLHQAEHFNEALL